MKALVQIAIVLLTSQVALANPHGGQVMTTGFHFNSLNSQRKVSVYLPPGYGQDANRRYPVLYMVDGQNLFSRNAPHGGWQIQGAMERAVGRGLAQAAIVVGIHTTGGRTGDLTFSVDPQHGGGKGARFLNAVVSELKPEIDRRFQTRTAREHTAVGGSSLGGHFALNALLKRSDVFGRILPMSPSTWWNNAEVLRQFGEAPKPNAKIVLDSGDSGDNGATDSVADTVRLRDVLLGKGMRLGADLIFETARGHAHKEKFWRERFERRFIDLFPAE